MLSINLSDQSDPNVPDSSTFLGLSKRGFQETLAIWGIPIIINNGAQKLCLAGPVQIGLALEAAGRIPESKIRAIEMLAEDFDEFDVVPNTTKCFVDGLTMTIMEIDRDPQDACVRFNAVGII